MAKIGDNLGIQPQPLPVEIGPAAVSAEAVVTVSLRPEALPASCIVEGEAPQFDVKCLCESCDHCTGAVWLQLQGTFAGRENLEIGCRKVDGETCAQTAQRALEGFVGWFVPMHEARLRKAGKANG